MLELHPVTLGRCLQWITLHGDPKHPLLVYLHGGPGAAELAVSDWFSNTLTEHFCVVNWDQRGAGRSQANVVSVAQLTTDCLELLEYLKTRYHPPATYLLGHSWGSFLGLLALQKNPSCADGLICVGPLVSGVHNEIMSHQLAVARAEGQPVLKRLLALETPPYGSRGGAVLRKCFYLWWLGGFFQKRRLGYDLAKRLLTSPLYSSWDKAIYLHQFRASLTAMQPELEKLDLLATTLTFEVPLLFCVGRHDLVTPLSLAQTFYDSLQAPAKEFVIFEEAAHSLHYENPQGFAEVVKHWQQTVAALKEKFHEHFTS